MYKRVWQKIFAILAENQLVQNTESLPEKNLYLVAIWQELSCLFCEFGRKSAVSYWITLRKSFFSLFGFSQHKFSLIESLGDNLFSVAESYAFC